MLTFVLLGAVVAIGAVAWLMMESGKPGPLAEDKVVNILREDDGGSIADQLERAGVIDSAIWFNLLALFDGNRAALKRGEYEFKAGDSLASGRGDGDVGQSGLASADDPGRIDERASRPKGA